MSGNRICVLIPYFGHWPTCLPLYLKSCTGNPGVDFVFLTDLDPPSNAPGNVRFMRISLSELCAQASRKLGFPFRFRHAYKLCDLRPAFGVIFDELIGPYDFWGHGDIDLVYGDLRRFFTDELLASYDILSAREEWLSGGLCLFRNAPAVKGLFREEPAFAEILQDERHRCFDETGFQWRLYQRSRDIMKESGLRPSMTLLARRAAMQGRLRVHFRTLVKEEMRVGDLVRVESGRVFDRRREYLFYHFVHDKRRRAFSFPDWEPVPDVYYIRTTGFYTQRDYRGLRYVSTSARRRLHALLSPGRAA